MCDGIVLRGPIKYTCGQRLLHPLVGWTYVPWYDEFGEEILGYFSIGTYASNIWIKPLGVYISSYIEP